MSATVYRGADFSTRSLAGLSATGPSAKTKQRLPSALPWCDLRTLQEAARASARSAEVMAVLADRAADASLKSYLGCIAEAHAEESLLIKSLVDQAFAEAQDGSQGGAA